jgi:hypothetical protein
VEISDCEPPSSSGGPEVLDGKHAAIAAASNPHVHSIPVMIVETNDMAAQAKAVIGQNTDRLGVIILQLHRAALATANEGRADARAGLL